ncbi:MAG: hypothetical protein IPK89_06735 [Sphingomonadales bacterium]|nr:hypothetical protein [Sphingomonadales bacterium]
MDYDAKEVCDFIQQERNRTDVLTHQHVMQVEVPQSQALTGLGPVKQGGRLRLNGFCQCDNL